MMYLQRTVSFDPSEYAALLALFTGKQSIWAVANDSYYVINEEDLVRELVKHGQILLQERHILVPVPASQGQNEEFYVEDAIAEMFETVANPTQILIMAESHSRNGFRSIQFSTKQDRMVVETRGSDTNISMGLVSSQHVRDQIVAYLKSVLQLPAYSEYEGRFLMRDDDLRLLLSFVANGNLLKAHDVLSSLSVPQHSASSLALSLVNTVTRIALTYFSMDNGLAATMDEMVIYAGDSSAVAVERYAVDTSLVSLSYIDWPILEARLVHM